MIINDDLPVKHINQWRFSRLLMGPSQLTGVMSVAQHKMLGEGAERPITATWKLVKRPSMDWFKGNNYIQESLMIFMEKSDWFPVKIFPTKPIHRVQGTKKHEEKKQLGGTCCWNRTKNAFLMNCNKTWGLKTVTSHSNDKLVEGCFFSAKMAERRCNLQNNKNFIVRNGGTTWVNAAGCFSRSTMTRVWRKIDLSLL